MAVGKLRFLLALVAAFLAACSPSADTTTTSAAETTQPPTTTTTQAPTTTTTIPEDRAAFVGWWEATDGDGSQLNLRVDVDRTFMRWDSASGVCEARGLAHSPETWAGTATFPPEGESTLRLTGTKTCFPYGADNEAIGETSAEYRYDAEIDILELATDGVQYQRTPLPLLLADSNPFVGVWEATDSDGTHVIMSIAADGTWEQPDTRSSGCENMGLTYATHSASGTGMFELGVGATPTFVVVTTTMCHPVDGNSVPRSEDVLLTYEYREASDEVALVLFLETIFTRMG